MSQKSAKSAAELESMIMAELREHPECDSAGVESVRSHKPMTPARRGSPKSLVGFVRSSI